ncbi:DUF4345 domain-containing protein [Rhizobium oryziradicis]|uniref:DUF4345 domain-containing protein n=1 Tax=Rhizobium oryziradicis TaxID=1867956 RepID=A0A1Q8ZM09_9HYPH|nr:DUF4345 domain-containing protein [Rhizobium oryziradicis]OLP42804.1 DUF4345 domain-containing protein [Rhizobium oryziradicis]
MQFYFPTELGEQLAFTGASLAALLGFVIMFAPGLTMRFFGLVQREDRFEGMGLLRFLGGMMLGLGLSAILLAQVWVYIAIGATFGIGFFGLALSMLQDHGATFRNILFMVVVLALIALPLAYVFGLF